MRRRGGIADFFKRASDDIEFLNFFFFDALFGMIIGILVWLFTASSLTSLIIGLLVGIIPLLIELRLQASDIRKHVREEMMLVHQHLEYINGAVLALHLDKLAARAPHSSFEALRRLIEAYSHLVEHQDRLFFPHANRLLHKWADEMGHLDHEHMELWTPEDIHHQTMECLRRATTRVFATSYAKIADFWSGGQGEEYRRENIAKAKAGVQIDRVFIFDTIADAIPLIREVIEEQIAAGIQVRIAWSRNLHAQFRRDMAIFDNEYVEYLDLKMGSWDVRKATVHRSSGKLQQAEDIMTHIMTNSDDARKVLAQTAAQRQPRAGRPPARRSVKRGGHAQNSRKPQ